MIEEWKIVPELIEHGYQASNLGRIKVHGHIVSTLNAGGRGQFNVSINRKQRCFTTAQLVLLAFVGPAPVDKPWALHEDDTVTHNQLSNLYWGSPSDNLADRQRNKSNLKRKIIPRLSAKRDFRSSSETHQLISKRLQGRAPTIGFTGRKHTEETLQKMRKPKVKRN